MKNQNSTPCWKKIVKWQKSRSECCDFTKKFECMIFNKKDDRKRNERKSWELTVWNVRFISFFFFGQSDQNTKKSFSGKMRIFYTENKETGHLIFFRFWSLTKKRKMKNGMEKNYKKQQFIALLKTKAWKSLVDPEFRIGCWDIDRLFFMNFK